LYWAPTSGRRLVSGFSKTKRLLGTTKRLLGTTYSKMVGNKKKKSAGVPNGGTMKNYKKRYTKKNRQ